MNLKKAKKGTSELVIDHDQSLVMEVFKTQWEEGFRAGKREWVGLTDAEIKEIANWADNNAAPWYLEYAYAIERKLKEKNK